MKATCIKWDIDEADDVSLPTEIDIPPHITDLDEIADYLSNLTGYCHRGFVVE